MKQRIFIYETTCIRCGKKICTTNRSIYGLDELKTKVAHVCQDCDPALIKAPDGGDAGMQLDIFGGKHLVQTFANEVTAEAAEIIKSKGGK